MLSATTITDETQRIVGIYTYLAVCFMILLGVVGINRYNKCLVYFYAIYLGLELISRIIFVFYFSWNVFFIYIYLVNYFL